MPTEEHHEQLLLAMDKCCQIAAQLPNHGYVSPLTMVRNAYRARDFLTIFWVCEQMHGLGQPDADGYRGLHVDEARLLYALQACLDISKHVMHECRLMSAAVAANVYLLAVLCADDRKRLAQLNARIKSASMPLTPTELPAHKPANLN